MQQRPVSVEDLAFEHPLAVVPLHISPDGRWITLSVESYQENAPDHVEDWAIGIAKKSRVLVLDTRTGQSQYPFGKNSFGGRWSPDGKRLAAYVYREGHLHLGIWEVEAGDVQVLQEIQVRFTDQNEIPQWTPDSRGIVVKVMAQEDSGSPTEEHCSHSKSSGITIWSFDPETQKDTPELSEEHKGTLCDLAYIDVVTEEVRRLAYGWVFTTWRIASDGHAVAVLRQVSTDDWDQNSYNLMIVPLDGSPPHQLVDKILQSSGYCFNWSPDSRLIGYTSFDKEKRGTGRLFVVPTAKSSTPMDLTADEELVYHGDMPSADIPPIWSMDGKTIYCQTDEDLRSFSVDMNLRRKFTLGPLKWLRGWIQRPLSPIVWPPEGNVLLVTYHHPVTKDQGLARVDLTNGKTSTIVEFKKTFGFILQMEGTPDGRTCYFCLEASDHPVELWRIRIDAGSAERVFTFNPHTDTLALGKSRVIEWRSSDGMALRGALMLPSDYTEDTRLPIIIDVYDGYSASCVHHFGFEDHHNAHLFASRGYGFLLPDLPLGDLHPMQHLPGMVLPAVNRLIELGIADPDRIGLMGESYGGYLTYALITQTARFRAAVAIAGFVNMTSYYGSLTKEGDSWGVLVCEGEGAQGRMGGSLWEKREAYIENSPLFYMHHVRTPVLIVTGGDQEWEEDGAQAKQAFSALRRLKQRVELRIYHEEGHTFRSLKNRRDLWNRIFEWFDTYLKSPKGG